MITGGDPIVLGLAASFNRPGGNATGATVLSAALGPKRLDVLRELIAPTDVIAVLVNPDNQTAKRKEADLTKLPMRGRLRPTRSSGRARFHGLGSSSAAGRGRAWR